MKVCRRCGVAKPLEDFGRDRHQPDGRMVRCRACHNETHMTQYYRRRARERRECAHCGVTKPLVDFIRGKDECLACRCEAKVCVRCSERKPLAEFAPDRRRLDGCQSHCRVCTTVMENGRRTANIERYRERDRSETRKATRNANLRRRRASDPEHARYLNELARLRHQQRRAGMPLSELAERDGWRCYLCGELVDEADAEVDHIVPVALGGTTLPENVALTHRNCNRRKQHKPIPTLPWVHPRAEERWAVAVAALEAEEASA